MPGPPDHFSRPGDAKGVVSQGSQRSVVQLDKNENPFDVPPALKDETLRRLAGRAWSRFPDETPKRLLEKLAAFNEWDEKGILVGNGSSELAQSFLEATVRQGIRILIPDPAVGPIPQLARQVGAEVLGVPLTDSLQFNIPRLCSRVVAMKANMVILGSPHNPAGCVMAESDLVTLLKITEGFVVVDEAYHEFARKTFAPLLKQYPNLVLLRTFSIALGMAALRIGYLMAAPELVRQLNQDRLPYHLNLFSATAAEVAIDYHAQLRALIEKVISERERVYQELRQVKGIEPVPSHANFMILRSDLSGRQLCELLEAKDILVYDLSAHSMLTNSVRVSVGTPKDNDRLIAVLKEILPQ
ncbi:MAG: aminotransferase class I/II-fold pyridoxal phosphate-dependent enzyme [Acidobacteria bacterium]|nr:aminotransferase class I/II-fold pyridoxal phosphate-dependent enzyme [Acidobacteriota bacterium]